MKAHFNTAGSGLLSAATAEAMRNYLEQEQRYGAYETELRHAGVLEREVYENAARLVGADAGDIALFDSATRAWVTALQAVELVPRSKIWISPYEYAGNLLALQMLRAREDVELQVIPLDPRGDLDLDWMRRHLASDVAMISVVHIPSGCGIISPIEEISRLISESGHRPLYFVDACQSLGLLPLDVRRLGCDVLTGAGRKYLCGPRGTAFGYFSRAIRPALRSPYADLHVAEVSSLFEHRRTTGGAKIFELGEKNNAAVAGLSEALRAALVRGVGPNTATYQRLNRRLDELDEFEVIRPGTAHAGIATIRPRTVPAPLIVERLRRRGFNTWVVDGKHTPIFMSSIGLDYGVRISVHHYNTDDQVDALTGTLREISAHERGKECT